MIGAGTRADVDIYSPSRTTIFLSLPSPSLPLPSSPSLPSPSFFSFHFWIPDNRVVREGELHDLAVSVESNVQELAVHCEGFGVTVVSILMISMRLSTPPSLPPLPSPPSPPLPSYRIIKRSEHTVEVSRSGVGNHVRRLCELEDGNCTRCELRDVNSFLYAFSSPLLLSSPLSLSPFFSLFSSLLKDMPLADRPTTRRPELPSKVVLTSSAPM